MKKIGLLPRIVIAIVLGVLIGNVLPEGWVRVFVTFNYVFSQFLGFLIPLIIIGLVVPAIADIGRSAGKLLLLTVGLAYADTIIAGLLAFFTGTALFPAMIDAEPSITVENVLVSSPSAQEVTDTLNLTGRKIEYILGIPKGNEDEWENQIVEFFGHKFISFGIPEQGIEENIPLSWHKKVRVERYE
jgi:hypothetical protein